MKREVSRVVPIAIAVALAAATAHAQDARAGKTDARLAYKAPHGVCPSDAAFVAQVAARTTRLHRVERGGSLAFVVEVSAHGDGFRGQLTSSTTDGAGATREVFGDTCDEVVGALGLILALAVDPGSARAPLIAPAAIAATAPPAPTVAPAPSTAPAPSPPDASAARDPSAPTDPPSSRAPAAAPPPPASAESPRTPARTRSVRFGAGAGVASIAGIAPDPLIGGALFVEATFGLGALRPTLRLSAQRAASGTIDAPNGGSARLTWTVGTLDACPATWGSARVTVSPCARIDAGALAGSGADVAHPRDDVRVWLDAGALARGQWSFVDPLFLDLEAGAVVALTRPRFHFDSPDVPIREPAPVGGLAALHLGGRFP